MTAARSPILAMTIAALVLLAEAVGLVAYKRHQEQVRADTIALKAQEKVLQNALEARAKLDALLAELERLDEEIRRMPFPSQIDPSERKQLRRQLKQLRIERRELNDMLIVPALRVVR